MINNISRCFQLNWLKNNPGLVYSESKDGGYCKYCALFGKCQPTVKEMGVVITRPLITLRKPLNYWENIFTVLEIQKVTKLTKMLYMMQICP